jgi:isocitrate dehydrogenase
MNELNEVQGVAMDIDGYYFPSSEKASQAMRPSETFNSLLNVLA